MSHEALGTEYCPNCCIILEKMKQLEIWENNLMQREEELENEVAFIQTKRVLKVVINHELPQL